MLPKHKPFCAIAIIVPRWTIVPFWVFSGMSYVEFGIAWSLLP